MTGIVVRRLYSDCFRPMIRFVSVRLSQNETWAPTAPLNIRGRCLWIIYVDVTTVSYYKISTEVFSVLVLGLPQARKRWLLSVVRVDLTPVLSASFGLSPKPAAPASFEDLFQMQILKP